MYNVHGPGEGAILIEKLWDESTGKQINGWLVSAGAFDQENTKWLMHHKIGNYRRFFHARIF